MKITYPREKRRISGNGQHNLYVVICRFSNGTWGLADFWEKGYVSKNYFEAVKMKNHIFKGAYMYSYWKKEDFSIAKINF